MLLRAPAKRERAALRSLYRMLLVNWMTSIPRSTPRRTRPPSTSRDAARQSPRSRDEHICTLEEEPAGGAVRAIWTKDMDMRASCHYSRFFLSGTYAHGPTLHIRLTTSFGNDLHISTTFCTYHHQVNQSTRACAPRRVILRLS